MANPPKPLPKPGLLGLGSSMPPSGPSSTQGQGLGGALNALAMLMNKPVVKNIWYNSKELKLDGYHFVDCRFDKCRLSVSSTEFELERCFIAPDTVIVYSPNVIRPIRLFLHAWSLFDSLHPEFAPTRHPDGTISIK